MDEVRGRIVAAYEAINSGDVEKLREFFTADMVWHQPGNNIFSGDYIGLEQMISVVKRVRTAGEGRFRWDVTDILVGESHAAAIVETRSLRSDKTLREIHLFRIDATGLAAEAWSYSADQSKSDRGLLAGAFALVQDMPEA